MANQELKKYEELNNQYKTLLSEYQNQLEKPKDKAQETVLLQLHEKLNEKYEEIMQIHSQLKH